MIVVSNGSVTVVISNWRAFRRRTPGMELAVKAFGHHSSRQANLVERESDACRNPEPRHQELHVLVFGQPVDGAPGRTRSCREDG